ncbi:uncharacterized protein LOC108442769 [Pygocentrus nattereri]|uniref:uncharacterized protein LOC108442769 n=1 Tax=Pygocentrus nattereri TaxID=42514 RepID=UPI0008149B81|nr:uncharacterized protein LOC108442769 [Pygocentrus nattereri]
MRGLPGEMLSSSLAFLSGAGPGVLLVMVVIGSVGDVTVAAVLTYAILAIGMAALIYGFLVPMDSVVEKWRDISTGDVAQGLIGFIFKVLRGAKPLTVLGVVITLAAMLLAWMGKANWLILDLGIKLVLVSELATFSTATAVLFVMILQEVHWDQSVHPVWLTTAVLMALAVCYIMSKVAKVLCIFLAVYAACFYTSQIVLMIILTPVLLLRACLCQCVGEGLASILMIAVMSTAVIGLQGAVGPAALLIPCVLLRLSQPHTEFGPHFVFSTIAVIIALWVAKSNVWSVEFDLKHVLTDALGGETIQALPSVVMFVLLFGVPILLAISLAVAVQILLSNSPKPEATDRGRLLTWAATGAAVGSALALRMYGEQHILFGLACFWVIFTVLYGLFSQFCRHSVPSKQAAQHCSQLSGMYKTALITGLGVAVIPGDLGFVLTGLGVFITIKTAHLVLELQEQYKKFWKMMSHLGMKAIKRTWM